MSPIIVGPGLQEHLQNQGDHPIHRHEQGMVTNQDGTTYEFESVWGTKGWYLSSNASGQWENIGPLSGPEQ